MIKAMLSVAAGALLLAGCSNVSPDPDLPDKQVNSIDYPLTKKDSHVDEYFGQQIKDPFRWLEDDKSTETAAWVDAQNAVTFGYLGQIPFREQIKQRLTALWDVPYVGAPFNEGEFTYYFKNSGLQNQNVLYRKGANGKDEVFLDPNQLSEDGTVSLGSISFSKSGKYLAYSLSTGGSDWRDIKVIDVVTKEPVGETLVDVKFTGIEWVGDEGFFYSSYDLPDGSKLSAKTDQHILYYHELGTSQSSDKVIFGAQPEQKHRYVFGGVTDDARYLVIYAAQSTYGRRVFLKSLEDWDAPITTVLSDFSSNTVYITSNDDALLFQTDLDAPNKRLVAVSPAEPKPEHWVDIIPEQENVLSVSSASGYLFARYLQDAVSLVQQFDYQGELVRQVELPSVGSANGFSGKKEDKSVYFGFSNAVTPYAIYELAPETGDVTVYEVPESQFQSDQYVSSQVFYRSKDGTRVPMVISHKKDLELDGSNATILYGYGGFNISLTPSFSKTAATWMEMGGVWAVANLRGGGEYGKRWHKAGTKLQKQNVFDDFIAAAEFLIEKQYTSPSKLAIQGGSNGGLLVGATMLQRPELFAVALPAVGVLDMLRYHKFTAGAGWAYDYGTSDDSNEMFEYLLGYSPLHNVKAGVEYPATLVTTADHDDRVVPAHSFKFAAELQDKYEGATPMMIRIDKSAGHGAGTPTSKRIELYTDIYSFTLANMGITSLPSK